MYVYYAYIQHNDCSNAPNSQSIKCIITRNVNVCILHKTCYHHIRRRVICTRPTTSPPPKSVVRSPTNHEEILKRITTGTKTVRNPYVTFE